MPCLWVVRSIPLVFDFTVPVDIFLIASSLWIIAYQIDQEEIE